jgi:hypothetical protein
MTSQFPPAPAAQRDEAPRSRPEPSLRRHSAERATRRFPLWAYAAAAAAIAAIAVVAFLVFGSSSDDAKVELGKPRIVSQEQLSTYAKDTNRTVFWAGPAASGFKLELTEVRGKRVFVRYLTSAAKAGDPRAPYTTVATYPVAGAFNKLRAASSRTGAVAAQVPGGGAMTLYYKKTPSNVYVARPGSDYLVEVFAPQPRAAYELAGSSQLVQVK